MSPDLSFFHDCCGSVWILHRKMNLRIVHLKMALVVILVVVRYVALKNLRDGWVLGPICLIATYFPLR
jgi:hypothetical protein